jgi:hypothetical protein
MSFMCIFCVLQIFIELIPIALYMRIDICTFFLFILFPLLNALANGLIEILLRILNPSNNFDIIDSPFSELWLYFKLHDV